MTDIEIARGTKLNKIVEVANDLGIDEEDISLYGKYKCKIDNSVYDKISDRKDGKLILVTAISPTPLGEGKTTMSIAIAVAARETKSAWCLWSLFFVALVVAAPVD